MKVEFIDYFWSDPTDQQSRVFHIIPDVYGDDRGNFTEIYKIGQIDGLDWFNSPSWIQQVNRSESVPNVFRGMHAQRGMYCQSKLVECVVGNIIDVILDARPNSETFGKCMFFELSSAKKNRLFVPKGFLHGFYARPSKQKNNIFQYFIGGGTYQKCSEISVNPKSVIDEITYNCAYDVFSGDVVDEMKSGSLVLSDKDMQGIDIHNFLAEVKKDLDLSGTLWYK